MSVPYTFSGDSGPIPLSQLDTNFATPAIIGGTSVALGSTVTTIASLTLTNATISSATINNATVGATTANTGAFTTLSASSTVSGTGFSTYLASPPAIGGTAAAAVSSTALSYSTTLTGGTGIVNLGSGQFYKDASGNVGIGMTPSLPLDITAATGNIRLTSSTGTNYAQLQFSLTTRAANIPVGGNGTK